MTKAVWKKLVVGLALAMVIGGGFLWTRSLDAYINTFPPGDIVFNPCKGFKNHPAKLSNGLDLDISTYGSITVGTGSQFKTSDGRNGLTLRVIDVSSSGEVEGLGSVTVGFDKEARVAASTLVANQTSSDYPATQTMRFRPVITVNGNALRALDNANLVNSAVTSTPPAPGTVYVLTNAIRLEDPKEPGKVAMVIEPGEAFRVDK
jgi:hypothetical protein